MVSAAWSELLQAVYITTTEVACIYCQQHWKPGDVNTNHSLRDITAVSVADPQWQLQNDKIIVSFGHANLVLS